MVCYCTFPSALFPGIGCFRGMKFSAHVCVRARQLGRPDRLAQRSCAELGLGHKCHFSPCGPTLGSEIGL